MQPLLDNLKLLGHECFLIDLPITYEKFDVAASLLGDFLEEMIKTHLSDGEKIHFVGHSTGGLVIRKMLSETKFVNKIGRCVLIATPNKGSKLANIASKLPLYGQIYKTLGSISYKYIEQMDIKDKPSIEIGAIAGNSSNLFLGHLINEESDGRVEVKSVDLPNFTDFIVLAFGHKEIHNQKETAKLVEMFLEKGKFK